MDDLLFTSPTAQPPGTVLALLAQAWAPLWNPKLAANIAAFDREVAERPQTVGACTFISCLAGEPIGMASYDPRGRPASGEVGHNCVVPEHQRRGFGKRQILEVLRRFRDLGIRTARVTTTDEPFFVPAMRTYESCGFLLAARTPDGNLEYTLRLDG